jgi:hypothetical protein
VNGSYVSQLIVNVSESLIGTNVECTGDTKQILLTTGTFQSIINFPLYSVMYYSIPPMATSKQYHTVSDQ